MRSKMWAWLPVRGRDPQMFVLWRDLNTLLPIFLETPLCGAKICKAFLDLFSSSLTQIDFIGGIWMTNVLRNRSHDRYFRSIDVEMQELWKPRLHMY